MLDVGPQNQKVTCHWLKGNYRGFDYLVVDAAEDTSSDIMHSQEKISHLLVPHYQSNPACNPAQQEYVGYTDDGLAKQ